jgi:capsid protein
MSVAGASLDPTDRTSGRRRDKLQPGTITYLKQGEQVSFGTPTASTNEDTFTTQQLRAFAAGVGIPYEVLTGDLSKTNFSSNRLGLIEYRLFIEELQWLVLVPQLIQPIREWWRQAYQDAGGRPGDKPDRITMPRRPWVKPTEDVAASKEAERAGYTTKGEVLRELGWASVDEYIAERSEEMEKLKAAGLQTDTDSGAAAPGAAPGQAAPNDAKKPGADSPDDEDQPEKT